MCGQGLRSAAAARKVAAALSAQMGTQKHHCLVLFVTCSSCPPLGVLLHLPWEQGVGACLNSIALLMGQGAWDEVV